MALYNKKVFISYAHRDDSENFVSRLGYALDFYVETFWDRKLQAGVWSEQLEQAIIDCDVFVVVMSQLQAEESKWCRKELEIARQNDKTIIPLRRFSYTDKTLKTEQRVDFRQGFDKGFQMLTFLVCGKDFLPWEGLYHVQESEILEALKKGLLPSEIAHEIIDWVIVNHLWSYFLKFTNSKVVTESSINPQTPQDVCRVFKYFEEEAPKHRDFALRSRAEESYNIAYGCYQKLHAKQNADIRYYGQLAFEVIETIIEQIERFIMSHRDFRALATFRQFVLFDIASKLREIIIRHSRNSRYLY